jgi:cobalt/nickel transport system permease protein
MHMADALISPAVGGALWAASAGMMAYAADRLKKDAEERRTVLMGVLGAFIFAAQMINFTIPGTGSSGHLGGGMLLAILLGPHAAFLAISSVLMVQALFFADGGLLALGCNIFNLGLLPCFVAYPLIYRSVAGDGTARGRVLVAAVLASVAGLQLGALGVIFETVFSGVSELPFQTFTLLMLPIHLAIGLIEGLVTSAVVGFVGRARPEILNGSQAAGSKPISSFGTLVAFFLAATFLIGGLLSWFASARPDGLEWSISRARRGEIATPDSGIRSGFSWLQEKTAVLPDYGFKKGTTGKESTETAWPAVDPGTSLSGILGGTVTLCIAGLFGFWLRRRGKSARKTA